MFGDLHLKPNDSLGSTVNGNNTRLDQKFDMLELALSRFQKAGVQVVVELGDTYDRINPPDHIRNRYAEIVSKYIKSAGFIYYRILGNHEVTGGKYGASGQDVGMFSDGKYIVIDQPKLVTLGPENKVLMIPEVSIEEIEKSLEKYPQDLVMGHFGVQGMFFVSGEKDTSGVDPKYFSKRQGKTYLGHIHTRQTLNNNIHFIGCVARANFGDMKTTTGITLVDLNGILSIEKYIELKDMPLCEIKYCEGDDDPFEDGPAITPSIYKFKYVGSRTWFMSLPVTIHKSSFLKKGVLKIFSEFKQVGGDVKEEALDIREHSFEQMIELQAKEDKVDVKQGLKYLEAASE